MQGVGFRPFVYRLARANSLFGWVLNGEEGVEIFLEGPDSHFLEFMNSLTAAAPAAAQITEIKVFNREAAGFVNLRFARVRGGTGPLCEFLLICRFATSVCGNFLILRIGAIGIRT